MVGLFPPYEKKMNIIVKLKTFPCVWDPSQEIKYFLVKFPQTVAFLLHFMAQSLIRLDIVTLLLHGPMKSSAYSPINLWKLPQTDDIGAAHTTFSKLYWEGLKINLESSAMGHGISKSGRSIRRLGGVVVTRSPPMPKVPGSNPVWCKLTSHQAAD